MSAEAVKLKVEAEEAAAEERRRKARETFLSFQQAVIVSLKGKIPLQIRIHGADGAGSESKGVRW